MGARPRPGCLGSAAAAAAAAVAAEAAVRHTEVMHVAVLLLFGLNDSGERCLYRQNAAETSDHTYMERVCAQHKPSQPGILKVNCHTPACHGCGFEPHLGQVAVPQPVCRQDCISHRLGSHLRAEEAAAACCRRGEPGHGWVGRHPTMHAAGCRAGAAVRAAPGRALCGKTRPPAPPLPQLRPGGCHPTHPRQSVEWKDRQHAGPEARHQ